MVPVAQLRRRFGRVPPGARNALPGPLEDAYAGLLWTHQNARELQVDPDRIGIGGGSAGAGLAAGLALLTRDRGQVPLLFQLLLYPMIDDTMTSESSSWEVPIWPPASNRAGWQAYLGDRFGGDVPIYAAAARAKDLTGLPQATVVVGTLDGFLDEDVDYALRLNHAGVPTELHVYPGAPHGFDALLPGTTIARRARADMEDWLARRSCSPAREYVSRRRIPAFLAPTPAPRATIAARRRRGAVLAARLAGGREVPRFKSRR
ncbi:MAG: alpha/beta hydrolase fold domain-containing protein [Dehalococcoidia bacterium]|nr:alpha/beta hydrolase fold domain-containing protein [Dehalococcoidia bacterium]